MKPQAIRLLDVFVIGPLMLVAAQNQPQPVVRAALTLSALLTIVYNGANYLKGRDRG